MVGSDPGPIDGFLGPKTFAAMDDCLEDSGWSVSTTDVITLLDKLHCERVKSHADGAKPGVSCRVGVPVLVPFG